MKFTLHIDCDNAAFDNDYTEEIGRILSVAAVHIRQKYRVGSGHINDISGNTVCTYHTEEETT